MIIAVNDKGREIADILANALDDRICTIADIPLFFSSRIPNDVNLSSLSKDSPLGGRGALIFIGAMGICVRSIAPYIKDKHTDPAVVCVDSLGKNVISVLSGHVGGANELTRKIATILEATHVITTQSDLEGLWALDTLAERFGWELRRFQKASEGFRRFQNINKEIAAFVAKEPTALYLDINDEGTEYLLSTLPEHVTVVKDITEIRKERFSLAIIVSPRAFETKVGVMYLHYIPHCLHVGLGLAHQAQPVEQVEKEIFDALLKEGLMWEGIADFNTIDLKADEPVVKHLQEQGYKFNFFTAEELSKVEVPNPSETVSKHVGTPSVCEASAILSGSKLILPKVKGKNWTLSISVGRHGHIEIVGAGPGDPDLISVRGRRLLEKADLILYAGSLVPKELTDCHKPRAVVRSSADMNLEEQFALMKEFYDQGKFIVRLHTGDPCIYGAIQEQMAFFDKYGMDYHITPGISSFLAAAAELRSQFTIPEKCQTIILTRGEGRTPMPDREKLHLLAEHQSTMCIFLSASLAEQVQEELLAGGYPPETPVAACHKLTWRDQRIYRGQLKDLAKMMKENNLTLTTMIIVGEAIDNRKGLSKLYDGHFTHLYRKGSPLTDPLTPQGGIPDSCNSSSNETIKNSPLGGWGVRLLIFGGTTEGRLAIDVCEVAGKPFYYSTKSDMQEVEMHNGVRLTGAMTLDDIIAFVKEKNIRLIIDAAHPFAENLHKTIDAVGLPVIRLQRTFGEEREDVVYCKDFDEAIEKLEQRNRVPLNGTRKLEQGDRVPLNGTRKLEQWDRVPLNGTVDGDNKMTPPLGDGRLLLALSGANTIEKLKPYWQKHPTVFRILDREESIEKALAAGLTRKDIIFYTHTPTKEEEMEMMKSVGYDAIITKESGEAGGFDVKVEAALELGLKVFVVKHPQLPKHWTYATGRHGLRRAIEHLLPEFFPLKTGLTTGACATAATKAALLSLLYDEQPEEVSFALPDGEVLTIPVVIEGKGIASVIKDYSDDPDVLRGCKITAEVEAISDLRTPPPERRKIRFLQGAGVGTVTLPGLGIPVGEPAINPTPRKMIEREIRAISNEGFDVTISVENGGELAKRTFNPKVGVINGISIIGTSGIVSPLSNEAFIESIGRELQVAKAIGCEAIGIVSGKKGENALKAEEPNLRVIHYGNFVGETLKKAHALGFKRVTVGIMIGKAVKLAEGNLDTHSHKVQMNKAFLKSIAQEVCKDNHELYIMNYELDNITMARGLWDIMPPSFFDRIRDLCYKHCRTVFPKGDLIIKMVP